MRGTVQQVPVRQVVVAQGIVRLATPVLLRKSLLEGLVEPHHQCLQGLHLHDGTVFGGDGIVHGCLPRSVPGSLGAQGQGDRGREKRDQKRSALGRIDREKVSRVGCSPSIAHSPDDGAMIENAALLCV